MKHRILVSLLSFCVLSFSDACVRESRATSLQVRPLRPTWTEYFEGAEPSWRLLHGDRRARLVTQQRTSLETCEGLSSEMIRAELPENACLVLGHSLEYPVSIEDLAPTLQVKSDQPGVMIGAQVVLPRAVDPGTGQALTFLVEGTCYSGSGDWEQLGFRDKQGRPNLSLEVSRQGALLRRELGRNLDLGDAYIRQIVLLLERPRNEPLMKTVWIDALEVVGHVPGKEDYLGRFEKDTNGIDRYRFNPLNFEGFRVRSGMNPAYIHAGRLQSPIGYVQRKSPLSSDTPQPFSARIAPGYATGVGAPANFAEGALDDAQTRSVYGNGTELQLTLTNQRLPEDEIVSPAGMMEILLANQVLSINNTPVGVRAIEYCGEPLTFLRQLEFNVVWVNGRLTPELLREAKAAGVWLIGRPPEPSELESARVYDRATAGRSAPPISTLYDNVLAWDIGQDCSSSNLDADIQRVSVLQNADRVRRRPIICTASSGVREYSRLVNIMMMRREPILSSLELSDLATWQRLYPTLARPDTPFWGTIQTQPSAKLANQWIMFEGNPEYLCPVSYEQLKIQIFQGLAAGNHGFLFTSNTPLTNNDPETEYRRTALELINWELQLLEEWFAAGDANPTPIPSNRNGMSSAIVAVKRSRLLVPLWQEPRSQLVVGPAFVGNVRYTIPGIPETYSAYHLVPGQLSPLRTERVAGGTQIELEEANLNTLIFFSEDDAMYARVGRDAKTFGPRAAYLACRLAELRLASTEQTLLLLKQAKETNSIPVHPRDNLPLLTVTEQESMIKMTKQAIDLAKQLAQQSPPSYSGAYLQAEKATRGLRLVERSKLLEATRFDLNPCMTPVSVSFSTLPNYLMTNRRTAGATPGPNRLVGGGMENVYELEQAGWQLTFHGINGVAPPKRLISPSAKRSGQNGLQMIVAPTNPEEQPKQLETVPMWLTTPPVPVRMGEMICVNGWIRIPRRLQSTVDGLMIFDTLGGEAAALRFLETKGEWREFAFYRNIPSDSNNYVVFFALHGFGEVHLDDLRIAPVQFEVPRAVEAAPPPSAPTPWQRLNPFQYLPPLPNWGQ